MAAMMLASMWTPTRPSSTRNWGLRRRQQQESWSASSLGSGIAETRSSSNSRSVMCCCYESSASVQNRSVTMAVILPLAACSLLAIFPASEANKKKYEAFDANFKASPLLQELLKKSKDNAELHKQEIQDKYCARGAEWGVGDCSLEGMTEAEKEAFRAALKK
ncbi:hypothetical protein BDL97_01G189800 [Sphagnum fallax]|nr:hypothetical protein BDL97_01G189800 [Sphagnum fallax]